MTALRDYQNVALDRLRLAVKAGARAPLLVSPTGSGKTVMLSQVVANHVAKGGSVNWYAHRRELTEQAAATLKGFGLDVAHAGLNDGARTRVLSIQGVLASGEVPACTMAIIDEAHHVAAAAEEWCKIADAHKATALIVGATATPVRGDGSPLSPPFDRLIVVAQVPDLIRRGHLVPVEVTRPSRRLPSGKLAQRPVDAYKRLTPNERCVVFAQHVQAAEKFAEEFRADGIEARVVSGKTPALERDRILARFAAGELRVVVNVFVLTEGFDCPALSSVIIARSVGSIAMYMQMIGRGLRTSPGKRVCSVLDLSGCFHTFGPPDQEFDYSLDGEGMTRKGANTGERLCRTCGAPLGELVTCGECGRDYSLELPEITGEKIDKFARIKQDTEAEKVARLVKWIRAAIAKGGKVEGRLKSLRFYKAPSIYGGPVPNNVWNTAVFLAKQREEKWTG